jgi:hypothetical protein
MSTTPISLMVPAHLSDVVDAIHEVFSESDNWPVEDRVAVVNQLREAIHQHSPFAAEPVDFVRWEPIDGVEANDYNPNTVAPPEMELLHVSILEDGYTQPIVSWHRDDGIFEVVDGFHRNRVGREYPDVVDRVRGFLPLTVINGEREDRGDRIASTIRHNRARGKHQISAMSDIVVELKRRNWQDERIARELGMERDEILRLMQITGLADLFSDQEFSRSWDIEGQVDEADFEALTDDIATYGDEVEGFRTVNTSDEGRIFHTYEKWECYAAGFYANTVEGVSRAQGEEMYRAFLSDLPKFRSALKHVITEWKHSCEHYLTNSAMNRIAWLGQAAMCYATGIPASYRSGFGLLTEAQQLAANKAALRALNRWLAANDRPKITLEEAYSYDRQSDIY